jgi:hypothetical protein
VHFALSNVVFCLDLGPFFFLLLFPCHELFIYFMNESIVSYIYCERIFYKIPRYIIIRPSSTTLQAHGTLQTLDGHHVGWSTLSCIGYMVPQIVSPKYLATISTTHVWHFLSIIYLFIYFKKRG